jgi:hypothetical protein
MKARYLVAFALFIISIFACLAFLVSYFIQPSLPASINSNLLLLIAAIAGTILVLSGFKDVVELVEKFLPKRGTEHHSNTSDKTTSLESYVSQTLTIKDFRQTQPVPPYTVEMLLALGKLQSAVTQKWREFSRNIVESTRRAGVTSAYGLLVAATFMPLLQAYATDPTPITIVLITIASDAGANLLSRFFQKVLNSNLTPAELEDLAKQDPEIQKFFDIIFIKTESIQAAQQELGDSWVGFSRQLKRELQTLHNSPSLNAILNGKSIIKDAAANAPLNMQVNSGDKIIFVGSFVLINEPSKQSEYTSAVRFGEQ